MGNRGAHGNLLIRRDDMASPPEHVKLASSGGMVGPSGSRCEVMEATGPITRPCRQQKVPHELRCLIPLQSSPQKVQQKKWMRRGFPLGDWLPQLASSERLCLGRAVSRREDGPTSESHSSGLWYVGTEERKALLSACHEFWVDFTIWPCP